MLLRLSALLVALSLLFAAQARPAAAQDNVATVRVDGRAVFQVGPSADDEPASPRARRIEQRLSVLIATDRPLGPAVARQTAQGWTVSVSSVPVVTVTARDAEDNLTTQAALAAQWAGALDAALATSRERRAGWGGRFGAEVRGSVEAALGRLGESSIRIVPRVLAAALVILAFWLVARLVRAALRQLFRRTVEDVTVESLVKQLTFYAIIALGVVVAVDALGFSPTGVAAGLGLTGIVLGFALKDILSNFVSGLLLLTLRPFQIGDQIVVGDLEGGVERIELRATRLRAYDGRIMLVPNAEVFTSRIVNNTANPVRRGKVTVWVGYDADLRTAAEAVRTAAVAADGVLEEPSPNVRIADLGQDDIVLEATFWTDSRRADFQNTASAVRTEVVAALKAAGVGLPDPDVRFVAPRSPEQWRRVLDLGLPR